MQTENSIIVKAYAKINLTLDVLALKPDSGYHDIRSIMQTIGLHDTLTVSLSDTPGIRVKVEGPEAEGVPEDDSNIVHRAAVRLQKMAAARETMADTISGLKIDLTKYIPSQAGLGGGSSDAAAALRAINRFLDLNLSLPKLTEIAADLGSDVPFFLTGGTALVEGLGEQVTPSAPWVHHWVIVVKPPVPISTQSAYRALDEALDRPKSTATTKWLADIDANHASKMHNDFEQVVFAMEPVIGQAYEVFTRLARETNASDPRLSGSGSALFTCLRNERQAAILAERLYKSEIGKVWLTQTVAGG